MDIVFGLGLLGWLLGFVLLSIATFRAKVLAGWYGLLLAAYPLLLLVLLVSVGEVGPTENYFAFLGGE